MADVYRPAARLDWTGLNSRATLNAPAAVTRKIAEGLKGSLSNARPTVHRLF
jgi:hypothetical protein